MIGLSARSRAAVAEAALDLRQAFAADTVGPGS
jgi:hypothetical protein